MENSILILIISAPAPTSPGVSLVFNLFKPASPLILLFPVARIDSPAAVFDSSEGQQSQQPAGRPWNTPRREAEW